LWEYEWWNLMEEEKRQFENYTLKPHPNDHSNNIYCTLPLLYIKCYIRHLEVSIRQHFETGLLEQCGHIRKLIKVVETYPTNGYYYLVHLYFCMAELNRNTFLTKLNELLSKTKTKKLKYPHGDLPLNLELTALPEYSKFVFDNRTYLEEASALFKTLLSLLKSSCLLLDNCFDLAEVLWLAADAQLLLAEYRGRATPKFYPLPATTNSQNEWRALQMSELGFAVTALDLSIRIVAARQSLTDNYAELGTTPLGVATKLDEDITLEIAEMDKLHKAAQPKMFEASARSRSVSSLSFITYLCKIYRESELMTFANWHLQNTMLRCHRILHTAHLPYREHCVLSTVECVHKKGDAKVGEIGSVVMKSMFREEVEMYLYIVGPAQK
jgi:hypothetical protein